MMGQGCGSGEVRAFPPIAIDALQKLPTSRARFLLSAVRGFATAGGPGP
jgi:hypothetical protein